METIILDKVHPECCALDINSHIEKSLGSPIKLPPTLGDRLSDNWANECHDDLVSLFSLMRGVEYEEKARDNTYNVENDLSTFMVWTVYAPVTSSDWVWSRDAFVIVEIGEGGDPRYSVYNPARIYDLSDSTVGDSDFLEFTLGWWAQPIGEKYDEKELDFFNDRITVGYSSNPYYEMEQHLYHSPVWVESLGCYVGRFKGCSFPVKLLPIEPCYG